MKKKIGMIGCGGISGAYFKGVDAFDNAEIGVCADLDLDAAKAKVAEFKPGTPVVTVDELLADPEVFLVLNLTTPQSHVDLNLRALEAGKHAYCEKPFGLDRDGARKVLSLAKEKGLRVGCAPDTFLGEGIQNARKILDDGTIGRPLSGVAFCMGHGHESWHKQPAFYYLKGGGPLLDMGPYYITALVNLLGPVKRVTAVAARGFDERIAASGERLNVEVNTQCSGVLEFVNGAVVTLVMSFDVWINHCPMIELYGETGSMTVPNPNAFTGAVEVCEAGPMGGGKRQLDWSESTKSYAHEVGRGIGPCEMIDAIAADRPHRCSGDLAAHVLDVMLAYDESSESGRHVELESRCERPAALPLNFNCQSFA